MKRLLSLIQAGRVELHLMNPARFHFPDQISIHASADEKCVIYAYPSNGHGGINVQIQEKTLRQAILGLSLRPAGEWAALYGEGIGSDPAQFDCSVM